MRTVKIEEYWPLIVKGTEEFGQIAVAENPEFNQLATCIYDVLKDAFIHDATVYGVSRWETMLGLAVTPDMSLDDRKVAILNYLSVKTPYTWRVLKQMLNSLLGEGNFEMSLDNETATLTVGLSSTVESMRESVDALYERVIPMNLLVKYDEFPIDYTMVEYLESTGTQYIDTGCTANQDTTIKTRWQFIEEPSYAGIIFSQLGDPPRFAAIYRDNLNRTRFDYGTRMNYASGIIYNIGQVYDIEKRGRYNYVDGVLVCTNPVTEPFESSRIGISAAGSSLSSKFRLYSFEMENNGELKLNLIPALDPTGAPCMFDTVSRKPFYNAGTGDFIYPTEAAPAVSVDLDEKFYAKLTKHGVRRLNKVPDGCTLSKDEYAAKHGFKELVEPPMPQTGYWKNVWRETETQLICEWIETEPPMEVTENE